MITEESDWNYVIFDDSLPFCDDLWWIPLNPRVQIRENTHFYRFRCEKVPISTDFHVDWGCHYFWLPLSLPCHSLSPKFADFYNIPPSPSGDVIFGRPLIFSTILMFHSHSRLPVHLCTSMYFRMLYAAYKSTHSHQESQIYTDICVCVPMMKI